MWSDLASGLATATSLETAFDLVSAEAARVLGTRTCLVERIDDTWKVVAQSRGGLDLSVTDMPRALEAIGESSDVASIDLSAVARGRWISIPLFIDGEPARTLLVAEVSGPTQQDAIAELAAWLPVAIRASGERSARTRRERLAVDVHSLARRLSRALTVEEVAERVVAHVAKALAADRVSIAVHRPVDDRLAVVAARGCPPEALQHTPIEPGAWVMGHVFATGRAVHIPDLRKVGGALGGRRSYRTSSFVAVPIAVGKTIVGVLSATDKSDGSPFDRHDRVALSTFGAVAALSIATARNRSEAHRLARAANIDPVTGVFNRTYLDARLREEFERARRAGGALALLMVDIDDFKAINDTYGHPKGDSVLQAVGSVLRSTIRIFDVCARYGGDEFAILMPNSDQPNALASAERIRQRVSESCTRDHGQGSAPPLTVSVGVAVSHDADAPTELVHRADAALYAAKRDGKNAVRAATPDRLLPPSTTHR